jgi:hypothetical protein
MNRPNEPTDMTPVPCEQVQDWIELGLDGRLAEDDEPRLATHLTQCAACAALAQDAADVRQMVRGTLPIVCPDVVVERVLAQVDRELAQASSAAGAARGEARQRATQAPRHAGARDASRAPRVGRRIPRLLPLPAWSRVAIPVAAAILLLLVVPMLARRAQQVQIARRAAGPSTEQPQLPGVQPRVDAQAAAAAAEQVKLALGIVGKTMDRTNTLVEENVRSSIADPFLKALDRGGRPPSGAAGTEKRTGSIQAAVEEDRQT